MDIKEELLGSTDFNQVIEQNLRKIEADAAQILAEIQSQKVTIEKSQRISATFEDTSKGIVLQHFPQLLTLVQTLNRDENTLSELASRLEIISNNINQQLILQATQNRILLLELLNKN
jgi:hypothetical protein